MSYYSIKKIKERDNNKCRLCGDNDNNLQVHHLTPIILGGDNTENNLITLCMSCHYFMHANPKFIIKQKLNHSNKTKEGINKTILFKNIKWGRPYGKKDSKPRSKYGYYKRWKK